MLRYAFIVLGMVGIIAFFPFNLGNSHTCLAHKYLTTNVSSCCENYPENNDSDHCSDMNLQAGENHHLTSHYLYPFGFLWWASIGLVVLQVRNIGFKRKRLDKRNKGQIK